jgi:L-ascorbate metabolism protein UlaG (beta-lactamase superfamily)
VIPKQAKDQIQLTYLGQAGLLVDTGQERILFDPYLSNYVVDSGIGSAELFTRAFPPPLFVQDLTEIDFVFISHDHADHCDPDTLLPLYRANPSVRFICPKPVEQHLINLGVDVTNILLPQVLQLQAIGETKFYAVPAAHYGFDRDPETGEYSYFGFVIMLGGKTLFHGGDTILYPGFEKNILCHVSAIDIACLPINGRDEKRERMGIVGNLTGGEAFNLAWDINSKILIPLHNDLFPFNSDDPKAMIDLAEKEKRPLRIEWMSPEQTLKY